MKRLFLSFTLVAFTAQSADKITLCRGHYHSEADAVAQLKRLSATHSNLAQWKVRASASE